MFVFRIQPTTDDVALKNWIEEKCVTLLDFHKVSHPDSKYKSFKITVSVTDYMFLYDSRQWPEGVCIEKFKTGYKISNLIGLNRLLS